MQNSKLLSILLLALLLGACAPAPRAQPADSLTGAGSPATAAPAPAKPAPSDTASAAPTLPLAPTSSAPLPRPESTTVGSGPVRVRWWHIGVVRRERANWQALASAYVAQHPNVSIEISALDNSVFKTMLAEAMQAGSPPDIFQTWGGGVLRQYAQDGLVQDLTPALAKDGWGKSFHLGPLSLYTFDGRTYGVPWSAGMVGFWYNKALFKQAGIAEPPATWAELLEDVKKLKAAGIIPIALGEKDKWPGHYYWAYLAMRLGGRAAFESAYSRQGSFADQPFVDAGVRLKELIDLQPFQPGFLESGYADQQRLMANGKAAMELMGQWAPDANRAMTDDVDAYNKHLGFFPFPIVEGSVGDAFDILGGGNGFALSKSAPKEAADFVRFLTSVQTQTAMAQAGLAVAPVVKGAAAGLKDPLLGEIQRRTGQTQYYQLYYDQYLPPAVGQAVNDSTQALFAGSAAPEQVAKLVEESAAVSLAP